MNQTIHRPSDDFLARLARARPGFSPKMLRVAEYLARHYPQAAILSTRQFAAAAGVSLATAVRFPRELGYADFAALRAGIQDRINLERTGVERLQKLPAGKHSPAALLRRSLESDYASLQALAQSFSEPHLERFVRALLKARRVTILGFRYAGSLAQYFAYCLNKIRPEVEVFTQADSTLYDRLHLMDGGDVVVAIAFPRYPQDLVGLLGHARGLKLRILSITDSPLSPVLPMAEVTLFAKASMHDFVGSLAAPAALINAIVSDLGLRLGKQALERLEALEEAADQAGIYVRGAAARGAADGRPLALARPAAAAARSKGRRNAGG